MNNYINQCNLMWYAMSHWSKRRTDQDRGLIRGMYKGDLGPLHDLSEGWPAGVWYRG